MRPAGARQPGGENIHHEGEAIALGAAERTDAAPGQQRLGLGGGPARGIEDPARWHLLPPGGRLHDVDPGRGTGGHVDNDRRASWYWSSKANGIGSEHGLAAA